MNEKINKIYLFTSVARNNQLITRFECHAAVCPPDGVQECLWIQEATGTAWIGLEQNIIDTAVTGWRNHLRACICTMDRHFEQFYCRQL